MGRDLSGDEDRGGFGGVSSGACQGSCRSVSVMSDSLAVGWYGASFVV